MGVLSLSCLDKKPGGNKDQLKLAVRYQNILRSFTQGLKDIYSDDLVSLILYGSAASGEFVDKHSNLNVLVVLKNTDLAVIKRASKLVRKSKTINALFLTEDYIANSLDIFPIEFLDMQENYFPLFGKDVLKDLQIDLRNLRFQCEQELRSKLIKLKQAYLALNDNSSALRGLLFQSINSILHVSRNVLRLKGKKPAYLKQDILKELASELKIDINLWEKILSAKNKKIKIASREIEPLFISFSGELERIVNVVDKL